jgi:outer membrane receptor for ferrienterochelin and colicins
VAWRLLNSLELQAGVILQRSPYDEAQAYDTDASGNDYGLYQRRLKTPDTYGTATAAWRGGDHWSAIVALKYTGPMLVGHRDVFAGDPARTEIRRSPAFRVWDIGVTRHVAWRRSHLDFTLGVRNLTDAYQADYESGASRDNDYVYGPRQPRSYFASVQLEY